jgi:hypothetical protein
MAWQTPKTNWQAADVVIKDDFNRIEGNIQHLQDTKETPAGAQAKAEAAAGVVQAELDAHKSDYATINNLGHIKHGEFDETIYADNWTGAEPPFTNEVSLAAITGTDVPIIDVRMTGTFATDTTILEEWSYIYRAVTATGKITFYATEKPEINLPIHVKVVR